MSGTAFSAGTLAGAGSFSCGECGFTVSLDPLEEVPYCPSCGSESFTRASMFLSDRPKESLEIEPTVAGVEWLEEVRSELCNQPGQYLCFHDGERLSVFPLTNEWTRIGRSLAADIRLDDPTVSRRHAMIVSEECGTRILDDRSLNGVFVNGERTEWSRLQDGDHVIVGRYELFFIDTEPGQTASLGSEGQGQIAQDPLMFKQ